jgi:cephalosporin-C deacetylase
MKAFSCFTIAFFLLVFLNSVCLAQDMIVLKQNHESGIYKKGEKIRVFVLLKNRFTDSVLVSITENFTKKVFQKMLKYPGDTLLVFDNSYNAPASLIFEIRTAAESAIIGAVVEPEKFVPGTKRPKDFDEFWKAEKRMLKELPLEVKSVPYDKTEKGYSCMDMEINCTGPKPARGYFAKPASARPNSLPIVLYLHAAGVSGSWCRSRPETAINYAKMGNGALGFDLNAHGMLNGQPDAYYEELEKGELKDYAKTGLESKTDVYFRGMYLRLIRTLEFLTSQPEWDGKRILVIGESQGGGQALAAAGLDSRVSAVVATVPAMCDWGGTLAGHKGGWPDPFETSYSQEKMLSALPYFDDAHILKDSKATIVAEIGLIDATCPAAGIFAAINQAKGTKIIYTVPYRAHHMLQPAYTDSWNKTVNNPKADFIKDYLK